MLVAFVAPYFSERAKGVIDVLASHPGTRLAVIGQEDLGLLRPELRNRLVHYARVRDAFRTDDLVAGAQEIMRAHGPLHRLVGTMEQLQVPLAEARDRLDVVGLRAEEALNFRDKTRMKDKLRAAGVPVARHRQVDTKAEALRFVAEVGYPVVVKPPSGIASQATYRVDDEAGLLAALGPASQNPEGAVLIEEFVTGEEHSFDAFVQGGRVVFYSISNYHPSPLVVMENPWMQWVVVLPRVYEAPDIAQVGARTIEVLGMKTGMCHLEWFRRTDGSVVISEVGARLPGAQLPQLVGRAHDVDCLAAWARLVISNEFDPFPPRKYAAGIAFLRGQGEGRVRAVHGWSEIQRELGALITDYELPRPNQEKSKSYEGEGYVMVRHPETSVVEDALRRVISNVRVELG